MTQRWLARQEWLTALTWSVCLALLLNFVSENLGERFELRAEFIAAQYATLAGQPYIHYDEPTYYPPFQNRVLFPTIFAALARIPILNDEGWYLALRTATAALLFGVCWAVCRSVAGATVKQAAVGCVMLAYAFIFTFNFKWVHTSDYPDGIFILLMLAATVKHNRPLLAVTALLGATNRESAAFAGVFWLCVHGFEPSLKPRWKEIAFAAAVSITAYIAVIALRYAFGGLKAIGAGTQLVAFPDGLLWSLQYALDEPLLSAWPVLAFAMIAPLLLWIAANYRALGTMQRRLLLAALLLTLITTVFGYVNELRIFIPTLVTLVMVAVWGEALASPMPVGEVNQSTG